jgi:tRNA dimethylallyltransferase
MKNPIIVIAGPTASGKTALAVELAKEFNGEVINADSRSVYKGMDIGTGKPSKDEMDGIVHHLFDIVNPDEPFTLMDYKELAGKAIAEILAKGKIPFLVGGTGLYIDAVVYDFEPVGEPNPDFRKELEQRDPELLYGMLMTFDPETAKSIDPKNTRRVIRALEIFEQTKEGKIKLESRKQKPKNVLYLAIDIPRENLYAKINSRVDVWMEQGFEDEVKGLIEKYPLDLPAMSGIGYKQIGLYLQGQISKEQAIEKFKQGDRNLAKKQMTWFRRNKDIVWIKYQKEAQNEITKFINS